MKSKILLLSILLTPLAVIGQTNPPPYSAFLYSGSSWVAAASSGVQLALTYQPPPVSLYCYNASTLKWVAADINCFSPGGAITPESFGALGNGATFFDGVTSASVASQNGTSGATSVTPSAPSTTTTVANEVVIAAYQLSAIWGTPPATGTNRVNVGFVSGKYGLYANDQLVAAAGSVPAVTGTIVSNPWNAATIALLPAAGQSITFVNSSSVVQSSGVTLTLPAPTGITAGMFEAVCFTGFLPVNPISWPRGFVRAFAPITTASYYFECRTKTTTGSEPANYVFNSIGPGTPNGMGAYALLYSGVSGTALGSATLSSATAGFTPASVGNLICVAKSSTNAELCGSISGYTSATSVTLGFPITSTGSSKQFSMATSDDAAFNTMLTTAPCSTIGCNIALSCHRYGLIDPLSFPANIPVRMEGCGAAVPNTENDFINGNTAPNSNNGTALMFLTTQLDSAALTASGGVVGHTSGNATDRIAHLAIYGGVGSNMDGGGADGLDIFNWQNFEDDDAYIFNFKGSCVFIAALAPSNSDYIENIHLNHHFESWCSTAGITIGSGNFLETINIENGIIENNGGPGLNVLANANIQGLNVFGNVSQWNNVNGANPEFKYAGNSMTGCNIIGNYFEGTNAGSQSNAAFGTGFYPPACGFGGNRFSTVAWTLFNPGFLYSVAGTALPSCVAALKGTPGFVVSDATTPTYNGTYSGSSTVLAPVICDGTNWKTY